MTDTSPCDIRIHNQQGDEYWIFCTDQDIDLHNIDDFIKKAVNTDYKEYPTVKEIYFVAKKFSYVAKGMIAKFKPVFTGIEELDEDGIPIEWEFKWGYFRSIDWENFTWIHDWRYNPNNWEDHTSFDEDEDGIDNYEEYLTSQWGSDPYRKDLFVELDRMEAGPNGETASIMPNGAKDLLQIAYNKHNLTI